MLDSTVSDQIFLPLLVALIVTIVEAVIALVARPTMDVVEPKPGRLYTTVVSGFILSSAALVYLFCQFNLAQVYYALVEMKIGNHFTAISSYVYWTSLAAHIIMIVAMPIVAVKYHRGCKNADAVRKHSLKREPHRA